MKYKINLETIIFFIVKFLVRLTIAKFLISTLIDRLVVDNKFVLENLKDSFSILLLFLIIMVIIPTKAISIPSMNINTSVEMETELKRANDLKERELDIQQKSMQSVVDAFKEKNL